MGNLGFCIVASLAMAISVYNETASILLAFLTYSLTGTLVLGTVLLTDMLGDDGGNQFKTTE